MENKPKELWKLRVRINDQDYVWYQRPNWILTADVEHFIDYEEYEKLQAVVEEFKRIYQIQTGAITMHEATIKELTDRIQKLESA